VVDDTESQLARFDSKQWSRRHSAKIYWGGKVRSSNVRHVQRDRDACASKRHHTSRHG